MTDNTTTSKEDKANILADLWLNYKNDGEFQDFLSYNDLGLPLAFALAEEIIQPNEIVDRLVDETFNLFLAALEIEDIGFTSLDDMFKYSDSQ